MEEDLIKSGILKEGEIDEKHMLNSPKKIKNSFLFLLGMISIVVIVSFILFITFFVYNWNH